MKDEVDKGVGVLTLTQDYLKWEGLELVVYPWKSIMLHALDSNSIYCQINKEELEELMLIPQGNVLEGFLSNLYSIFDQCALLNPDSESSGEGDFFFNKEEVYGNYQPPEPYHQSTINYQDDMIQEEDDDFEGNFDEEDIHQQHQ